MCVASFAQQLHAQVDNQVTSEVNEQLADNEPSPISQLGTDYQNSIKLLSNRFRIDDNVEEVTMVFFREYGASPVVLVRPDGSKLFQTQADGDRVAWFDSETYDMISIKKPVAGPWQAVGQILPDSRVMVLSDIVLEAQPLPPIIFSGEILKQTARLTNGGKKIDYGPFRDVVQLTIELASTNNPNYDNFGAQTQEIARYEDNGRGMDESALDGVFTGQFNLAIAAGEWKPIFRVTTPMFTREQITPLIQLYPTPILIDVELNGGGENYHKVKIDVQRDLVDINSLLVDGKVRFPNGDIQNFSLTELSDKVREHMVVAYEDGVFRVKLTAYGKTINGRDFILDVPEYSFLAKKQVIDVASDIDKQEVSETSENNDSTIKDEAVNQQETLDPLTNQGAPNQTDTEEEQAFPLALVLWINGAILIIGIIVILVILIIKNGSPAWASKISQPFKKKQDLEGEIS